MNRPGERGIVLIAVLLAVALMSVMVVAVTTLTRSGISSQRLEERLMASRFALRSGLEGAKALIAATPPDQRALFDGTAMVMDLGQGISAEITIRDAAGLADVNRSDMKLLSAVLSSDLKPDVAKSLAAELEDMRRKAGGPAADQQKAGSSTPAGASAELQEKSLTKIGTPQENSAKPEDQPKPLPVVFLSVDQLLGLVPPEAVEDAEARAVSASLTVFNPTGRVNPLAAPRPLLLATPGMTPQDIGAIDAARKNRAWKGNAGIGQILERLKPFLAVEEPSVFMIGVRLIDGPGVIAQSRAGAVVQHLEGGPTPFRTLSVSGFQGG